MKGIKFNRLCTHKLYGMILLSGKAIAGYVYTTDETHTKLLRVPLKQARMAFDKIEFDVVGLPIKATFVEVKLKLNFEEALTYLSLRPGINEVFDENGTRYHLQPDGTLRKADKANYGVPLIVFYNVYIIAELWQHKYVMTRRAK